MVSWETSIGSRWVPLLAGALLFTSCGGSAPPPPPPPPPSEPTDEESDAAQPPTTQDQEAAPVPFVFGVDLDTVQAGVFDQGKMWTFEFPPADHIEEATGEQPNPDAFVAYLADKIGALYGVSA